MHQVGKQDYIHTILTSSVTADLILIQFYTSFCCFVQLLAMTIALFCNYLIFYVTISMYQDLGNVKKNE